MPATGEYQKRSKDVENKIRAEFYLFQDLPMYILNTEATIQKRPRYLKRYDMVDVTQRLKIMHPLLEESKIPEKRIGDLPKILSEIVEMGPTWKVEWFYRGGYTVDMSLLYAERFRPGDMGSLMGRVADTVGLCDWWKAFALWEETLFRPSQRVFYEGSANWQGSFMDAVRQKVVMMSVVLDLDHVITVTSVKRCG